MKILDIPRSGSLAGQTSSRNRNGQYVRSRATPVQPRTESQLATRARLSENAASWRSLTDNQRAGWASLGTQMTRTDALGQTYSLTGFQAFVSVNNVLRAVGDAVITDAPALGTPDSLATATLTATDAALSLAYTTTPLPAGAKLIVRASPQRSAGRDYEGDLRVVFTSAAAAASPADIFDEYSAKFGVPVEGNKIFVSASVALGGFESAPFLTSAVVTAS